MSCDVQHSSHALLPGPYNTLPHLNNAAYPHSAYPHQHNNGILSTPPHGYHAHATSPIPPYVTSYGNNNNTPFTPNNNINNNTFSPNNNTFTPYNNNNINNNYTSNGTPFVNNNTAYPNIPYGVSSLTNTLNTMSMSATTFDAQRKGNFIQLSEQARTATATAENQTVATTGWLSQGVHSVAFRINYEHQYVCIGVVGRSFHGYQAGFMGYAEHTHNSWGVTTGAKYPDEANQGYGAHFKSGDVVRVTVDMVSRSLSYTVNGVQYGRAFQDLPENELCVAVSLHNIGDSVTIL